MYSVDEENDTVTVRIPPEDGVLVALKVGDYRCREHSTRGWPWENGCVMRWTQRGPGYCAVYRDADGFIVERGRGKDGFRWPDPDRHPHTLHERESYRSPAPAIFRAVELMIDAERTLETGRVTLREGDEFRFDGREYVLYHLDEFAGPVVAVAYADSGAEHCIGRLDDGELYIGVSRAFHSDPDSLQRFTGVERVESMTCTYDETCTREAVYRERDDGVESLLCTECAAQYVDYRPDKTLDDLDPIS